MAEIADDLGMTRDQLADRIVPDCGLDANGRRIFDFGPRQFEFAIAPDAKPMIRDAAGKLHANLPRPKQSDDAAKAERAKAEWPSLKRYLKETLRT